MDKEDFYFLLWGIGVAFTLQVLYDGFGYVSEGLANISKFYVGVIMIIVFFGCLVLFGRYYKSEKPNKG